MAHTSARRKPQPVATIAAQAATIAARSTRPRVHRCRTCVDRKFRTARDLALHILSKHGHAYVSAPPQPPSPTPSDPPPDDAVSVTQSSPLANARDMREIDRLLAAAQPRRAASGAANARGTDVFDSYTTATTTATTTKAVQPTRQSPRRRRAAPLPATRRTVRAPLLARFDDNSPVLTDGAAPATPPRRMRAPACRTARRRGDAESVSPLATDVYLRQCRAGHIPLIPLAPQPAETLNFASGLF